MSSGFQARRGRHGLRVLIIGASGTFGQRLVRLLARERGFDLVLGGRRREPLEALAAEVGGNVALIDRDRLDAVTLGALRLDAVVDASGPFEQRALGVPEAAIAAGIDYVDLADDRGFVAAVASLDAAARLAGVEVIAGASSTPALSHAAIDALCAGWMRIDTLRVVISPSNRQPRGRAVVASVLSGVGRALSVLRDGAVATGHGWGGTRRVPMPGLGTRWASWCDTPDMDLLRSRYRPRVAAEFLASLELPVMHFALVAIGRAVRAGWLRDARPLGGVLRRLSMLVERVGSRWGGMLVEAKGRDARGEAAIARWWLRAQGDVGPHVPVLPALAVLRRLRDRELGWTGAGACVGLLSLDAFADDFARLGIETGVDRVRPAESAFAAALGAAAFARLPAATQALHRPDPVLLLRGRADVDGGGSAAARAVARLFGLPAAARDVALRVVIEADADGSERWSRVYGTRVMRSVMRDPDPARATIVEAIGAFRFTLALEADRDGIGMRLVDWRLWRLPLPPILRPRIRAREAAEGGLHLFDVAVDVPLLGRLVRYRGWLDLVGSDATEAHAGATRPLDGMSSTIGALSP